MTGWYDFRNRDLIASEGRWAERDPLGLAAGDLNIYRDEGSSPVDGTDPSGLIQPQSGGYRGGRWNPLNWRRWAWTGNPNAPDAYYQAADEAAGAFVAPRIEAAGQTIGGVMETGGGAAMIPTVAGTIPGAVLVVHGVDTTAAGIRGMVTGETKQTLTKQFVTTVTRSEIAGTVVDAGIPLAAGAIGSIRIARANAAKVAAARLASEEAAAAKTACPAPNPAQPATAAPKSGRPNPVTGTPRPAPSFKPDPTNNVTATPRTVNQFLTDAENFLGKGYTQGKDGAFYSADGLRRVRFTPSDLAGHKGGPPHGHFEFNGGRNNHIPLTDN